MFWHQIFNVLRSVGQHAHSPTDSEYQCVYVRVSGRWESERESDRSELWVDRPEFPEVRDDEILSVSQIQWLKERVKQN